MRFVSPTEAAYVLGVRRESIWKWIKDGSLPSIQFKEGGKHCIDLASFLKSKGFDPEPYFETLDKMAATLTEKEG